MIIKRNYHKIIIGEIINCINKCKLLGGSIFIDCICRDPNSIRSSIDVRYYTKIRLPDEVIFKVFDYLEDNKSTLPRDIEVVHNYRKFIGNKHILVMRTKY